MTDSYDTWKTTEPPHDDELDDTNGDNASVNDDTNNSNPEGQKEPPHDAHPSTF